MTFDEYYDGERKSLREVLEKRPWLTALNFLVSPGRKLTAEDCELFWSLLKDAQEDAFAAGSEPGGDSAIHRRRGPGAAHVLTRLSNASNRRISPLPLASQRSKGRERRNDT